LRDMLVRRPAQGDAGPPAFIRRADMLGIAREILAMDLARRMAIPGMPPRRADIFPAACIVFETLLDLAAADGLLHSVHNLRYGLALGLLRADTGS